MSKKGTTARQDPEEEVPVQQFPLVMLVELEPSI